MLDNVADGIVTVSDEGLIESFNRAASTLFGYSEAEAIGQPFVILVGRGQRTDYARRHPDTGHTATVTPRFSKTGESIGCRKDGSTFAMELHFSDLQLDARNIHIGCLRDISERQTYTETLQHQALHDDLTDLPNRVLFGDRVTQAIRVGLRAEEPLALLLLDLDGFKQVNDTFGHQHGDDPPQPGGRAPGRMPARGRHGGPAGRRRVRDPPAGRHGPGRRRVGRLEAPAGARGAVRSWSTAQRRRESEHRHRADPEHGDNIDDLLRRADLAMYDAKRSGSGYALFAAEQEDAPRAAWRCSAISATASSATSSSCTTSRRSTSPRARPSAWRR